MQLPLLSGVVGSREAEFRESLPVNLEPVIVKSGIARGQLRSPSGALSFAIGPGIDRGGIEWNDVCYRVMGTNLVSASPQGDVTVLGDVGDGGPVAMDYGFDRLAINSGNRLYYWDGMSLAQVSDPDLGPVNDMIWIDGYYMTTDGVSIVVTELADPFQVLPTKYGSAEEDPDMVTGLIKVRGEAYALGRDTIQVYRNIGGNGFPFAAIRGASIPFGCVGPRAKALFAGSFAFVGGGRNERIGVYVAGQGTAEKISTRIVDDALAEESNQAGIVMETRTSRNERRIIVHLTTGSWSYLANASAAAGEPIWYRLASGRMQPYRPRYAVECYGKTIVGDAASSQLGVMTDDAATHFGDDVEWRLDLGMIYNQARGGILSSVELVGLPGRTPPGTTPSAFLSLTRDGETYSPERAISMGAAGARGQRLQWRPRQRFSNYMGLRFRGFNSALAGFAACEAEVEPLAA